MLTPLWSQHRPRRAVPVPSEPVAFDVFGKSFLYEPNDMRLFVGGEEGVRAAVEEAELVTAAKPQFPLADVTPRMLVLVLTHACTLRCRYCFHGGETPDPAPQTMTLDTARKALKLLDPHEDFTVGFFGGEALMAFGRLREIVREAKTLAEARNVRARFALTTNATLLDKDVAAFLDQHGFSLIVSLDGPAELHDAARPDAAGHGSHARTLAGLECAARYPSLARRTTLRGTFDGTRPVRLVERLRYLNDLATRLNLRNVSVEPADLSEGCGGGGAPVKPDDDLRSEYEDAARWYAEERRAGRAPKWHHLAVRLERLRTRTPAPSECGAGVGYLTVDADGTLHACHRLGDSRVGAVESGVDTELQAPWRDNRYYARGTCPQCWLRNVCGGGCRLNSRHHCGSIRTPDPLGCWLTETCTTLAAWVLSENTERES